MIQTKSSRPTLIADVELMRQLSSHRDIPNVGLCLNYPTDDLAQLLYNCYAFVVTSRGRSFLSTPELEKAIWEVAQVLTRPSYRFGIIMTGTCGNGKTTMLQAIRKTLYYLQDRHPASIPKNINITSAFVPIVAAKGLVEEIVKSDCCYMHHDIMMIDDLGHESKEIMHFGTVRTPIIDLLERRYARMKITMVTSNLTMHDIGQKYGARISDRLEEMMYDIEFTGDSFRF